MHHHALLNLASFHYETGGLEASKVVRLSPAIPSNDNSRTTDLYPGTGGIIGIGTGGGRSYSNGEE